MAISQVKVSAKMESGYRTEIDCSHPFVIDQPKMAGGTDEGPNPLEIFLSSLPACICAIGRIVATQKRINLRSINAVTKGDIDKDYLMGKTTEGRSGFTEIRTTVEVDADLTDEEKIEFIDEIERRCPVANNITEKSSIKMIVK